jgi:c-di-GMP-binding flagellar brake protein YcgR
MVSSLPGIRVGSNCNVEIEDREFGEVQSYSSRIEDLEEDRLFVDWPTKKGQQVEVANGEHVHVSVPTSGGATLFLDTEIVRRIPSTAGNPIAQLVVRVLAVGRQQQRGHFRLPISIQPTDCAVWERAFGASDDSDGTWKPVNATIIDISGGGVGLSVSQEVPDGGKLHLRFPYPMGQGEFVGEVRVRLVVPLTGGEHHHYKVGTAFEEGVDRMRRERLTRSIHRVQVEQRRRAQAEQAR